MDEIYSLRYQLEKEKESSNKLYRRHVDLIKEYRKLEKENNDLKKKNKFIFKQIKAFRDDCVIYTDFAGASTLNRLLDILDVSMEIWE